jgi:hypothetical protein
MIGYVVVWLEDEKGFDGQTREVRKEKRFTAAACGDLQDAHFEACKCAGYLREERMISAKVLPLEKDAGFAHDAGRAPRRGRR